MNRFCIRHRLEPDDTVTSAAEAEGLAGLELRRFEGFDSLSHDVWHAMRDAAIPEDDIAYWVPLRNPSAPPVNAVVTLDRPDDVEAALELALEQNSDAVIGEHLFTCASAYDNHVTVDKVEGPSTLHVEGCRGFLQPVASSLDEIIQALRNNANALGWLSPENPIIHLSEARLAWTIRVEANPVAWDYSFRVTDVTEHLAGWVFFGQHSR